MRREASFSRPVLSTLSGLGVFCRLHRPGRLLCRCRRCYRRGKTVFALGRRIVDHLVARGEPQFVPRRDQNGLAHKLPGKYLDAVERAGIQQLPRLNRLAEHDHLPRSLFRLDGANHQTTLDRARIERRQLRLLPTISGRVDDERHNRRASEHRRPPEARVLDRLSGPRGRASGILQLIVPRLVSEHGRVLSKRELPGPPHILLLATFKIYGNEETSLPSVI